MKIGILIATVLFSSLSFAERGLHCERNVDCVVARGKCLRVLPDSTLGAHFYSTVTYRLVTTCVNESLQQTTFSTKENHQFGGWDYAECESFTTSELAGVPMCVQK